MNETSLFSELNTPSSVFKADAAATYFGMLIFMAGSLPMMDRYLLPFVPLMIAMFAHVVPPDVLNSRFSLTLAVLAIIVYGYFSVTATHDYLAWNRARWSATSALMTGGKISARQIDGGYEFNGLLAYEADYKAQPDKSWWWVHDDTYMIASGPIPDYSEMARFKFHRWFLGSESSVVVLRKNNPPERAKMQARATGDGPKN